MRYEELTIEVAQRRCWRTSRRKDHDVVQRDGRQEAWCAPLCGRRKARHHREFCGERAPGPEQVSETGKATGV